MKLKILILFLITCFCEKPVRAQWNNIQDSLALVDIYNSTHRAGGLIVSSDKGTGWLKNKLLNTQKPSQEKK